jgi:N-acetylmuramoyl-L-alanine amidase
MSHGSEWIDGVMTFRRLVTIFRALTALWLLLAPVQMARAAGTAPIPAVAGAVVRAGGNQLTGDADKMSFILRLERPVEISAFTLADPYRVIVDLPEVLFPAGIGERERAGLVTSWRAGLFMSGRSRIVFDTSGPTRVARAQVIAAADGSARLELDVERVSKDQFRPGPPRAAADAGARPKDSATPANGQNGKLVIVVDPGHGGIDPGTRSPATGTVEKTVVLGFAEVLKQKLEATGRYEVHLTRTDDTFVPLAERVRIARRHKADLFLSVHADAEFDHQVRGATVYIGGDKATDDKSEALAAKENASDTVAGVVSEENADEVTDILLDLTRRETLLLSRTLAGALVNGLSGVGRMTKGSGQRSANLRVLKAYDIPSALVEIGFLTNKEDEALMTSQAWREKTAGALVGAVDRFFADGHAASSK